MTKEIITIDWEPPMTQKAGLPQTVDLAVVLRTIANALPAVAEAKIKENQKITKVFIDASAVHAQMRGQQNG